MKRVLGFIGCVFAVAVFAADEAFVDTRVVDFAIRLDEKAFPDKTDSCFLRKSAATALSRANAALKLQGLSVRVLRCLATNPKSPTGKECGASNGLARHSRGASVDLTLTDAKGALIPWAPSKTRGAERKDAGLWKSFFRVMAEEGFVSDGNAPGHFDLKNWSSFPEQSVYPPTTDSAVWKSKKG